MVAAVAVLLAVWRYQLSCSQSFKRSRTTFAAGGPAKHFTMVDNGAPEISLAMSCQWPVPFFGTIPVPSQPADHLLPQSPRPCIATPTPEDHVISQTSHIRTSDGQYGHAGLSLITFLGKLRASSNQGDGKPCQLGLSIVIYW